MAGEDKPIRRLQLLLHGVYRTDEGRTAAKRAAQEIGMTPSGEGQATLSMRMPDGAFQEHFPKSARTGGELSVPERLKPFVASVSEAPEHLSY